MILVISSAASAAQWAPALQKSTGERVQSAASLREAAQKMRQSDFSVLLVDQVLLEASPASAEMLWKQSGAALTVVANFAISGAERLGREVRLALARRQREKVLAVREAQALLRSELNSAVTGILLSSEIALNQPAVPPAIASKLRSVYELAQQMRARLAVA